MTNTLLSFFKLLLTLEHLDNPCHPLLPSFSQNHPFSLYHLWATPLASSHPLWDYPTYLPRKWNFIHFAIFIKFHSYNFHNKSHTTHFYFGQFRKLIIFNLQATSLASPSRPYHYPIISAHKSNRFIPLFTHLHTRPFHLACLLLVFLVFLVFLSTVFYLNPIESNEIQWDSMKDVDNSSISSIYLLFCWFSSFPSFCSFHWCH